MGRKYHVRKMEEKLTDTTTNMKLDKDSTQDLKNWKNNYITFSTQPSLMKIWNDSYIQKKVGYLEHMDL